MNHKKQSQPRDAFDFFFNDLFRVWVLSTTKEGDEYWQMFMVDRPHLVGAIEEAKLMVATIKVTNDELGQVSQDVIWQTLCEKCREPNGNAS